MVSYIGKRGGPANFYARLLVPDDLVEIIGRREYRKSLGTANPREAKAMWDDHRRLAGRI